MVDRCHRHHVQFASQFPNHPTRQPAQYHREMTVFDETAEADGDNDWKAWLKKAFASRDEILIFLAHTSLSSPLANPQNFTMLNRDLPISPSFSHTFNAQ